MASASPWRFAGGTAPAVGGGYPQQTQTSEVGRTLSPRNKEAAASNASSAASAVALGQGLMPPLLQPSAGAMHSMQPNAHLQPGDLGASQSWRSMPVGSISRAAAAGLNTSTNAAASLARSASGLSVQPTRLEGVGSHLKAPGGVLSQHASLGAISSSISGLEAPLVNSGRATPPPVRGAIPSPVGSVRQREEELNLLQNDIIKRKQQLALDQTDRKLLEKEIDNYNNKKRTMAADLQSIQAENIRLKTSNTSGSDHPTDAALEARATELSREVSRTEREAASREEILRNTIIQLNKKLENLKKMHDVLDKEGKAMEDQLRKELRKAKQDSSVDETEDEHYALLERNLDWGLKKQQQLSERLHRSLLSKTEMHEEWSRAEYEWTRRWESFKDEEQSWRQEQELGQLEQEKLDKVEQVLRQQGQTMQDKLDCIQKKEEEGDRALRLLRLRDQKLEQELLTSREERDDAMQTREQDLARDAAALRAEVRQLRDENEQLDAKSRERKFRIAQLEHSIEQLQERQRFFSQPFSAVGSSGESLRSQRLKNSSGPRGTASSVRSSSSGSSSRFSTRVKDHNCTVTLDGTTATRAKHCQQCVVLGDRSLEFFEGCGWFFELSLSEVIPGKTGGLGIGVTLTSPWSIPSLPDHAWRVPLTWIAGYWGHVFANGEQHNIDWNPSELSKGDRVGYLVTPIGEIVVYVNGKMCVQFKSSPIPLAAHGGQGTVQLTAIVDMFDATGSVTLLDTQPPGFAGGPKI